MFKKLNISLLRQRNKITYYNTMATKQTDLEAVSQDGNKLQCIKEQTDEICLAAVEQNGYALFYVITQTLDICIAAVGQNEGAFNFVNKEFEDDVVNHFTA